MDQMTITAIIPVFNAENTLHRAVDSLLKQTRKPEEIILVDNNSSDGSLDIMTGYKEKYPNLINILTEKKPGANAARNAGIRIAKGVWIQLLDADDELMPEKLQHQTKMISTYPDADLIIAPAKVLSGIDYTFVKTIKTNPDFFIGLINSQMGITSSNLWRHSALTEIGNWDEIRTSSQEYFTMLEFVKKGKNIIIDTSLHTIVYEYPESVSKSKLPEREWSITRSKLIYFEKLQEFFKENSKTSMLPKMSEKIYQNLYAYLINHGPDQEGELKKFLNDHHQKLNPKLFVVTYLHQVYAEKVSNKKKFTKYFKFFYEAIKGLNRLYSSYQYLQSAR
ncbi:MAG: glycosyltransferase family 2 protein [Saprospiraceae bacterium]|nr:glycosyltransferase family 2 protein [Saprospiraceae bacterium]